MTIPTPTPTPAPAATPRCPFARPIGGSVPNLADELRERTKDAHTRAERHPRQARMVRGEADRGEYAKWLGQMAHVWQAVDAAVATLAACDSRVAAMVKPYHPHAARVAADLAFLGHSVEEFPATPSAKGFARTLALAATAGDPSVIGAWYVLEGSANGGRFIAKALGRALDLAGPEGLMTLDPHGEAQRERWAAWRTELDTQVWTANERHAIVAVAELAFDAVHDIMQDLDAASETAGEVVAVPA